MIFRRGINPVLLEFTCQICNFKVKRQNEVKDDVLCLIESLVEQSKDFNSIR